MTEDERTAFEEAINRFPWRLGMLRSNNYNQDNLPEWFDRFLDDLNREYHLVIKDREKARAVNRT